MRGQHRSRWSLSTSVIVTALCLLALCSNSALATSSRPNPLKRISYATDSWIDVLSKRLPAASGSSQLHWAPSEEPAHPTTSSSHRRSLSSGPPRVRSSDSIRLSLRAFEQTFFLHLEPNDNLVPPEGAKMKVWRWDEDKGEDVLSREERINREDVRAYHGVVVHESVTSQRMYEDQLGVSRTRMGIDDVGVMGPAAIFLHDDGAVSGLPRFEGTFEWNGNTHTIQSARVYNKARQHLDPRPNKRSLEEDHLIIHRSSDVMTGDDMEVAGLQARATSTSTGGCSFGGHDYNVNNPLILSETNNLNTSRSPLDFFAQKTSSSLQSIMRRRMAWWDVRDDSAENLFDRSEVDDLSHLSSPSVYSYEAEHQKLVRAKRQNDDSRGSSGNTSYVTSIGDTSGCPKSAMVVYVGVAADCTYAQDYNGDSAAIRSALLSVMNSVSIIYRNTFNVSLGVAEVEVRDSACSNSNDTANWSRDCNSLTIDERLNAFSEWRGKQAPNGVGVWSLLTSCNSGAEVGVAWLGTLCMVQSDTSGGDTVSGAAVSAASPRIAQVVAHEIGHVFGAVHDCTAGCSLSGNIAIQSSYGTCCPQSSGNCNDNSAHIMSPVARQATSSFSACSIGNICTMLSGGLNTSCIETPGQRETLSSQQCGNGILEVAAGEECDAGPNGSACCSTDCKLVNGAVCDPSSSVCCQDTCQFAPTSTVCRAAKDSSDCDTVEYCTGISVDCPADTFRSNGEGCGKGLSCANGRCTSRDLQCQQQTGGITSYTKSCSAGGSNACSLSCQDPDTSLICTIFQTNFADGTSCGSGGYCQGGVCNYGAGTNAFTRWYRDNLRISIPVTIVIGIIVLLILAALVRCCCSGGSQRNQRRNGLTVSRGGFRSEKSARSTRRGPFPPPTRTAPRESPPSRRAMNIPPGAQREPPHIPPRPPLPSGGPGYYPAACAPYEIYESSNRDGADAGGWVDPTAWNGQNPALRR